jgi:hypothetical protein
MTCYFFNLIFYIYYILDSLTVNPSILDNDLANQLAAGNINMKNGEKQNSFPLLKMVSTLLLLQTVN